MYVTLPPFCKVKVYRAKQSISGKIVSLIFFVCVEARLCEIQSHLNT